MYMLRLLKECMLNKQNIKGHDLEIIQVNHFPLGVHTTYL